MKKNQQEIKILKDVIDQIYLKPEMQMEIKQNVQFYQKAHKNRQKRYRLKTIIAVAASVAAVIIIGVPVAAKVQSIIKARMEEVPWEKIDTMLENLDNQHTEVDTYSREFTETESNLLTKLEKEYRQGRFPEGEILQIDDVAQIDPEKICYLTTKGVYYFPEREMTEEELLEFIDFGQTLGYGLGERYQELYGEEIEEKEKTEKKNISQIVAEGGVDEAGAAKAAAEWMDRLYPHKREGMEQNTYLHSSEQNPLEDSQMTIKYQNLYMVYFGVIHDYYYFYINADTGVLSAFIHSTGDFNKMGVSEAETRKAIEAFLPKAKRQLKETFGITSYDKIYAYFTTTGEEGNIYGGFSYHFVTDAGDDYILKYLAQTGELCEYTDTLYQEYVELAKEAEEFLRQTQENYKEVTTHKVELE